jgi:hypothetical protein
MMWVRCSGPASAPLGPRHTCTRTHWRAHAHAHAHNTCARTRRAQALMALPHPLTVPEADAISTAVGVEGNRLVNIAITLDKAKHCLNYPGQNRCGCACTRALLAAARVRPRGCLCVLERGCDHLRRTASRLQACMQRDAAYACQGNLLSLLLSAPRLAPLAPLSDAEVVEYLWNGPRSVGRRAAAAAAMTALSPLVSACLCVCVMCAHTCSGCPCSAAAGARPRTQPSPPPARPYDATDESHTNRTLSSSRRRAARSTTPRQQRRWRRCARSWRRSRRCSRSTRPRRRPMPRARC